MNNNTIAEESQQYKTKNYYWLKLHINFFNSQEIKFIESQNTGEKYILFWVRLLLLAIQQDEIGVLRFKKNIPYTPETLATILDTDINVVRSALTIFEKLNLVEIKENGDIVVESVMSMVGSESESARRVRAFRERQKLEKQKNLALQCNVETDTEKDTEKESKSSAVASQPAPPFSLFFEKLSPKYQGMILDAENHSTIKAEDVYNYIPLYEEKTKKIVENRPAFILKALSEEWDLSGECYEQWGSKKVGYE